ncbi:MAG: hypothetical protein II143_07835 [Bacteroidales bacterium]|nr:hypothetical protein [Bacteroidales bacterium]
MTNWENIIKDTLEGYESPVPAGSLERFRARRSVAKPAGKRRLRPIFWVAGLSAAAALALFLVPKHQRDSVPVSAAEEIAVAEPAADETPAAADGEELLQTGTVKPATGANSAAIPAANPTATAVMAPAPSKPNTVQGQPSGQPQSESAQDLQPEPQSHYGTIPEDAFEETLPAKAALPAGVIAEKALYASSGAALLAGLTAGLFSGGGAAATPDRFPIYAEVPIHHFPLRLGITASLPIAGHFRFVSGAEYFLYSSDFNYIEKGEKHQMVHYIGVPLRLDWRFASIKRLDFYAGGGLEGNFCIAATESGQRMTKEDPSFSLMGTVGMQYRITDVLGLYVEPVLSWTPQAYTGTLKTYNTQHPLMISVSTGLRFVID